MSRRALIGAGWGVAMLILTWALAFHVGVFERADQSVLNGFGGLQRPHVNSIATRIAELCNPQPYVYLVAIPVIMALARGRRRVAVAVIAIILGANLTTQLLKPLLADPRAAAYVLGPGHVSAASWPSGHATAAMSLALCFVLAAPARLRPAAAALGATFAVAVSYSFLTLGWHYPSDVFGGFLVAGVWTLLGIAALSAGVGERFAEAAAARVSLRDALRPPALALLASLVVAGLVLAARPHAVVAYAGAHRAFVVGAAAIAALGLLIATGVMLSVRSPLSGTYPAPTGAPHRGLRRG
jgi:membrane-associated phospholipid phosphatase